MGVDGEIVASGLQFPEGPVWVGDALVFTEIEGGVVSRWSAADGTVSTLATTGGGPNGAAAGPEGALYVTQNGGMSGERVTAGIQRISSSGEVELVLTSVGGVRLEGPNDLAFGPDGRLWFTDPRGGPDPAENDRPGRLFAVDVSTGEGELVRELGPVFPNGIAFLADGTLVWTESFSRRVMAMPLGADPEVIIELPERHPPDGLAVGQDGRLYVATTYAHAVSVVDPGRGEIVEKLMCGDGMVTNCCFGGTDLYVTESRRGTIWRFPVERKGLPLSYG